MYVTDSLRPVLHRITAAQVAAGGGTPQAIPLGPEVTYIPGFNANGIVSTVDGRYVLFCTTGTGELYRVEPTSDPQQRAIVRVDMPVQPGCDGLELDQRTLYLMRNADKLVVKLEFVENFGAARVVATVADPAFQQPSTIAFARDRLMVADLELFTTNGPPYHVYNIRRF